MTHSLVMDKQLSEILSRSNQCSEKLWPEHGFWVCVHCDIDLGDMTLGQGYDSQGHDTPLSHEQRLCEILSRSNIAVRSCGLNTNFGYVCTVTLTCEI